MSDASEPLGKLAAIQYGKSPNEVLAEDGPFPIVGTGGKYGQASKAMFQGPAIVVPRKGSLGNPQLLTEPFWPVDTTYAVIPEKEVDVRWLYYNLLNFDLTKLNEATGVPSISRDWLKRIRFFDPGKEQRKEIGEILQATDEAIEKTESLIAKYQQIKAGLMHDLFTRGVTADGKLRPPREHAPELYQESPIGWIPKEWSVGSISEYLDKSDGIKPGPFGSSLKKEFYTESGYRVYGQEQVIAGSLGVGNYYISRRKFHEMSIFEIKHGDLLISLVGTIGRVLVVREPFEAGIINPRLMRIRPHQGIAGAEFLKHLLITSLISRQLEQFAGGGTMPVLNATVVRKLKVPVIDMPEQERISQYLDAIALRIESEERVLNKYSMHKLGLMHDLLTGRVPVKPILATTES